MFFWRKIQKDYRICIICCQYAHEEKKCSGMGLSMTTAFTTFAKKVSREKRIPFEVSAGPFYSESNMAHLRRGIAALNTGKGSEDEFIEGND